MAIKDSTGILDTSIFLKSKLRKNMVGENYYIQNAQAQRNAKWEYRTNLVDIEEELEKQIEYTQDMPNYSPTEAVVQTIKDDKGKALSNDYANIVFKELNHQVNLGKRYRFSFDFDKTKDMTEEEKYLNTCIWIEINESKLEVGNNSIVRRCNSNIGMVGSPNLDYSNVTEYHYEPCILENDLKNMNIYYNQSLNIPNAEWYVIMQLNYFTNFIKINDVLLLGGADLVVRDNNATYKVKAISKACGDNTFFDPSSNNIENVPFITLALEKNPVNTGNDIAKRIVDNAPIYLTKKLKGEDIYTLEIKKQGETEKTDKDFYMCIGDELSFTCYLYNNNNSIDLTNWNLTCQLDGTTTPQIFFECTQEGNNFIIKDKKAYNRGKLVVIATKPDLGLQDSIAITLGGVY